MPALKKDLNIKIFVLAQKKIRKVGCPKTA